MKIRPTGLLAASLLMTTLTANISAQELKPRIIVLTDIAPGTTEPDDMESMVRLLAHADLFEIEAIITTSGWNSSGGEYNESWTQYLSQVIDAYEKDLPNLCNRSEQTGFESIKEESTKQAIGYWPSAEYLRIRSYMGSLKLGAEHLGIDNDSPGSEAIISLIEESDSRPLWVLAWGGGNTVAQALWKLKESGDTIRLNKALDKIRIYTITDQDVDWGRRGKYDISSHKWMRKTFGDKLKFIWDESAWLSQNEIGASHWKEYEIQIQGKGNLGKVYPRFKYGVEGDTPSFLYVMPIGLNDPDDPTQVSWGGYFNYMMSDDGQTMCYTNKADDVKLISRKYEELFYPAAFNNFASRMEWASKGDGNRNPIVSINGDKGLSPIRLSVKSNSQVNLDASGSFDPDGDNINIRWLVIPEAGYNNKNIKIEEFAHNKAKVKIPHNSQNSQIHIICEATDNSQFNLKGYRRIIITVE